MQRLTRSCRWTVACGLAFGVTTAWLSAQTVAAVSEVAGNARRAAVFVRSYGSTAKPVAEGSGFLLESRRIVTAAHVIKDATRAEVFDASGALLGSVDFAEAVSTTRNLAILPALPAATAQGLRLAAAEPQSGERVMAVGAAPGEVSSSVEGQVMRNTELGGVRYIEVTATIPTTYSGGPLINMRGEVVGVNFAAVSDGRRLNLAIPVRDLIALSASPRGRIAFLPAAPVAAPTPEPTRAVAANGDDPGYREMGPLKFAAMVFQDLQTDSHFYEFAPSKSGDMIFLARSGDFSVGVGAFDMTGAEPVMLRREQAPEGRRGTEIVVSVQAGRKYAFLVTGNKARGKYGYYAAEVYDQRWLYVSESDSAYVLVDRQSVRMGSDFKAEASVKFIQKQKERITWGSRSYYDTYLGQQVMDCRNQTAKITKGQYLLEGRVVESYRPLVTQVSWDRVNTGTVQDGIFSAVCFVGLAD